MKYCIIIRGNSGSGKSSLASKLQETLGQNTVLLPQDTLRRHLLNARDGFDSPTVPLYLSLIDHAYQHHDILIIEGILHRNWYAPVWEKIAELYGDRSHAYYYDLPFEETIRRHQTRSKVNDFSVSDMKRWWLEKDNLNRFNETILGPEISLGEAKQIILLALKEASNTTH